MPMAVLATLVSIDDLMKPWADDAAGRHAISARFGELVGTRLVGCRYLFPAYWDGYRPLSTDQFDVVDTEVRLALDDGRTATLGWMMEGAPDGRMLDGLRLAIGSLEGEPPSGNLDAYARWRLGGKDACVISVEALWQETERPGVDSVWAVRLDFLTRSIVVALGEVDDEGLLRYMPDALVVIFDEVTAQNYQPRAAGTSAWGCRERRGS